MAKVIMVIKDQENNELLFDQFFDPPLNVTDPSENTPAQKAAETIYNMLASERELIGGIDEFAE